MIRIILPYHLRDASDERVIAELTDLYGPGRIFDRSRDVVWWQCDTITEGESASLR